MKTNQAGTKIRSRSRISLTRRVHIIDLNLRYINLLLFVYFFLYNIQPHIRKLCKKSEYKNHWYGHEGSKKLWY